MASRISSAQISAAAEIIGGNEDLVMEILVLVPLKSAIRFKSVSKAWLSLISGRTFSIFWQQQHPDPKTSGLFFACKSRAQIKYIPLMDTDRDDVVKTKYLARFPYMYHIDTTIIRSCNGLLLCCLTKPGYSPRSYQVYNPTTKQFRNLPWPFSCTSYPADPLYLAFDPSKSLHYKLVLLHRIPPKYKKDNDLYQIHIYSSETDAWRAFGGDGDTFSATSENYNHGVYWNGSIHWIFYSPSVSKYFDVNEERLGTMPSPVYKQTSHNATLHFGECRGHLHLISKCEIRFNVDISEMESDYSKWVLKYRVDYSTMMVNFLSRKMIISGIVSVLGLVRGEDEGDVFLVLFVGDNMIISYNIKDNTFNKLHDVAHHPGSTSIQLLQINHCSVYPYMETLLPV